MPNYPYISGQAGLVATFAQLRRGVPAKVDAGYLQRFNIARANESYVISILKFLSLIDEEGNRVEDSTQFFYHDDDAFKTGLESTLRSAYSELFKEMGDDALDAEKADLTHWFRASDKTSDLVGQRQATTFLTLAALAGHGEVPTGRSTAAKRTASSRSGGGTKKTAAAKKAPPREEAATPSAGEGDGAAGRGDVDVKAKNGQDVGLTVRIEVNLPPGGDADTYDAIFASIKKHLMS